MTPARISSVVFCVILLFVSIMAGVDAQSPADMKPQTLLLQAQPSGQPSPIDVNNYDSPRTDGFGNIWTRIWGSVTSTINNLLTTDFDTNGGANVTTGAVMGIAAPGAGGAQIMPGDSVQGLGVQVRDETGTNLGSSGFLNCRVVGYTAHDSPVSVVPPVYMAGRGRSTTDYTAVASDDVAAWAMTLDGKGRVVNDANANTRGLDVKYTQAEAGGSTDVQVKASAGNLYSIFVSNPNTSDVYLSLYDATTASTTVGSTTQKVCLCVPGGSGASNAGSLELTWNPPITFATAITYALTTTASGSTAPSSACVINIGYK